MLVGRMSYTDCPEGTAHDPNFGSVHRIIEPKVKDLGEFSVRRALPHGGTRMVGPWIFFDHFGPAKFEAGQGMNVRPHPHINLATVTYLFEGEIHHKDSLGSDAIITPGAINLMVAGKGIVHSERPSERMDTVYTMEGLQLWHALPEEHEETDPAFHHYPSDDIPTFTRDGVKGRVMMGTAFGVTSPVKTFAPTLYFEARMQEGASLDLPEADELAIYTTEGDVRVDGVSAPHQQLTVLDTAHARRVTAHSPARFAAIGGQNLGRRHIAWNFVSSRRERIEEAKRDWMDDKFPKVPGDSEERIPLPESERPVMYP